MICKRGEGDVERRENTVAVAICGADLLDGYNNVADEDDDDNVGDELLGYLFHSVFLPQTQWLHRGDRIIFRREDEMGENGWERKCAVSVARRRKTTVTVGRRLLGKSLNGGAGW